MPFGIEQYQKMAELMRSVKGKVVLSINDHPDIKETFKGFPTQTVSIDYTVGGAHKGAGRNELIICNW